MSRKFTGEEKWQHRLLYAKTYMSYIRKNPSKVTEGTRKAYKAVYSRFGASALEALREYHENNINGD